MKISLILVFSFETEFAGRTPVANNRLSDALRKQELHEERLSNFEKKKATAILVEGRDPDDEQLSDPQASELESGIDDDDAESGGEDMDEEKNALLSPQLGAMGINIGFSKPETTASQVFKPLPSLK